MSVGEDIEASLTISFMEAVKGTQKPITVTPIVQCQPCRGSGAKPDAKRTTCQTCRGTGQATFAMGGFHVQQPCPQCGGEGTTIRRQDQCASCDGKGRVRERKQIKVEVPAGCDSGMRIRMQAQGDAPLEGSGPAGDLYVKVRVLPSQIFRRKGSDIYYELSLPFTTAVLGGNLRVPTVDGDVEVKIKAGTQPGDELRLRGKGVHKVGSPHSSARGDQYLGLKVGLPKDLTDRQREMFGELAKEFGTPEETEKSEEKAEKKKPGFFDKFKKKL